MEWKINSESIFQWLFGAEQEQLEKPWKCFPMNVLNMDFLAEIQKKLINILKITLYIQCLLFIHSVLFFFRI